MRSFFKGSGRREEERGRDENPQTETERVDRFYGFDKIKPGDRYDLLSIYAFVPRGIDVNVQEDLQTAKKMIDRAAHSLKDLGYVLFAEAKFRPFDPPNYELQIRIRRPVTEEKVDAIKGILEREAGINLSRYKTAFEDLLEKD